MKEYQRKRRFLIDADTKKEFAKKFNCDVRTVEKAMYFANKSPLAKLMQIEARKRDLIVWVDAPECETIHTWDNKMEQYFPNGAVLFVDKTNWYCKIVFKEKIIKEALVKETAIFNEWQAEAAALK